MGYYTQLNRQEREQIRVFLDMGKPVSWIAQRLNRHCSTEQISGRLKQEGSRHLICPETIYHYIYRHPQSDLYRYLPMQRAKRRKHYQRKTRSISWETRQIMKRPTEVDSRHFAGYWEGDTIRFSAEYKQSITTKTQNSCRYST